MAPPYPTKEVRDSWASSPGRRAPATTVIYACDDINDLAVATFAVGPTWTLSFASLVANRGGVVRVVDVRGGGCAQLRATCMDVVTVVAMST